MGNTLSEIFHLKCKKKRKFMPAISKFQSALWKSNCLMKEDDVVTETNHAELIFNVDILNWTTQILYERILTVKRAGILDIEGLSKDQVIAMASFAPTELLNTLKLGEQYACFIGVLMLADISGFTSLCEKYAALGPVGAFRLTATLNAYLGSIIQIIFHCGGDLLKFAGDSFIAVWRLTMNEYLNFKVHEVIECAMRIQNTLGLFVTDVGVILKVKISISVGNFIFCLLGNDLASTYVLYGLPILEAKQGESYCSSGDIVIAPSAFECIDENIYLFKKITKGFLKVKHILDEKVHKRDAFYDYDVLRKKGYFHKNTTVKNLIKSTMASQIDSEELHARPDLKSENIVNIGNALKPFISPPVLNQIKSNSTFHAVTEMRQVTIMFVRFKPSCRLESEILNAANVAYSTISNFVKNSYGLVNKMVMYDKDVMILAIFGMKGYKQKQETKRCLNCASKVRLALKDHHLIKDLSIGVTVGSPYCGVVGHVTRKEFTVIGRPVNRAARLMCRFREMISCDFDVVKHSTLPIHNFRKLENVHLKGIGKVKDIFQYLELSDPYTLPPILGRKEIMQKFQDMLTNRSHGNASGLLIMGPARIGKTRLLNELEREAASKGWESIWVTLRATVKGDVCLLYRLISGVLGKTKEDRTSRLINIFKGSHWYHKLHLLNEILDVNFPKPYRRRKMVYPENSGLSMFIEVLSKFSEKVLLMIDDAHVLDSKSWLVLCEIVLLQNIITIVSIPNTWTVEDQNTIKFLNNPSVIIVRLSGLHLKDIGPLACQIMHVQALPTILPRVLHNLSGGNPGWIQTFLLSYLDSGLLRIKTMRKSDLNTLAYKRYSYKYFSRNVELQDYLRYAQYIPVCKLSPDFNENVLPAVFDDVFLAMFDKLYEFDQMLLKNASIIGEKFNRSVLLHLLNRNDDNVVCEAYHRLFDMLILSCASTGKVTRTSLKKAKLECSCEILSETPTIYPKYAYCKFSRFNFAMFRFSLYNIVPSNQKVDGHLAVIEKISSFTKKCYICLAHTNLIGKRTYVTQLFSQLPSEFIHDNILKKFTSCNFTQRYRKRRKLFSSWLLYTNKNRNTTTYKRLLKKQISRDAKAELRKGQGDFKIEPFLYHFPNLMDCSCYDLRCEFYEQLIYHSEESGMTHLLLNYLLDYAELTMKVNKLTVAVNLLLRAKEAHANFIAGLKKKKKKKKSTHFPLEAEKVKVKKRQMKSAFFRICANLASCYLFMGRIEQTKKLLTHAGKQMNPIYLFYCLMFCIPFFKSDAKEKIVGRLSLRCQILMIISQLKLITNKEKAAILFSFLSTVYANSIRNITLQSMAYCNYLDLAVTLSKTKLTKSLEKTAIKRCSKNYIGNDSTELIAMGQLFGAVFKSRFLRGNFFLAAGTGLAALKFADKLEATEAEMYLVPMIIQCLVRCLKFQEIYGLIEELKYDADKQFFLYVYHTVNLELFLDTGIYSSPVEMSYEAMKEAGVLDDITPEYELSRRFAIYIWLLFLRHFLLLKAYYKIILFHYKPWRKLPGFKDLKQAYITARKSNNKLTKMQIKHNVEFWFNSSSPAQIEEECYKTTTDLTTITSYHLSGQPYESLIYQTLPLLPLPLITQLYIDEIKTRVDLYKKYSKVHKKYFVNFWK
ncbi:adenylate cyclase type 10-like isoform X3 [Rhodnius prolixus]|uniref:adenylate cyclase type 10-like isoform X3 n=1 Tax=Rhodnius prolixus TaxID=13249 RepID=UPI003D187E8E